MTEYHATKYDSARDEVIALLADEAEGYGMRDDSSGEADAPTGYFALVTIPAGVELVQTDLAAAYHVTPQEVDAISDLAVTYGVTPAEVIGSHIVTHNSQGFVSVETFDSEELARAEFDRLAGEYAEWADDGDDSL
jgi:hypothetical protein